MKALFKGRDSEMMTIGRDIDHGKFLRWAWQPVPVF